MRYLLLVFGVFFWSSGKGQSFILGKNTSFFLGSKASFFSGGKLAVKGTLNNQGVLVGNSDIDFVTNTKIGNIKFTGEEDQMVSGKDLVFNDFVIEKAGYLHFVDQHAVVNGFMNTAKGALKTTVRQIVMVTGTTTAKGKGYVEGKVFGLSSGRQLIFPMGIKDHLNYLTLVDVDEGLTFDVEIRKPDLGFLKPDKSIVGIDSQVEWVVMPVTRAAKARIRVDYSGIDLQNFGIERQIKAMAYEPALVMFNPKDSLYHKVEGTFVSGSGPEVQSFGVYESLEKINISSEGIRLSIALVPIRLGPHFYVPNSFAPKGIFEENRVFRPFLAGEKVNRIYMKVFDSFKKEVYLISESGEDLDLSSIGWDGSVSGGFQATNGVYYYTIQLYTEANTYNKSGAVLLLK